MAGGFVQFGQDARLTLDFNCWEEASGAQIKTNKQTNKQTGKQNKNNHPSVNKQLTIHDYWEQKALLARSVIRANTGE